MNAPQNGHRISISVRLDADYYAFVEKFMAAGTFDSRDQLFEAALDALVREIEASAREAATKAGYLDAEEASLKELADMLDHSVRRWREN